MLRILPVVFLLVFFGAAISDDIYLPTIVGGIGPALTSTPTGTSTGTASPTETATPTGTATSTGTATPTSTATQTGTATSTPTPSGTATSTSSPTATDTPSATPTQTSTPTTTPTVTPTATEVIGDGITILNNHTAFVDSIDFLNIVGEARNDSEENAEFVSVSVNLFNPAGTPVDTYKTYVRLDVLQPGEKGCFRAFFSGNPDYSYYEFETEYTSTLDEPRPLTIVNHNGIYDDSIGWLQVTGQIRNDGEQNETYPKIVGTLYDHEGRVIDCNFTYANADELSPSEMSIWQIIFRQVPENEIASYRIQPD